MVGYGVRASDGMKYWILKNSWDTNWGQNGYFLLENTNDDTAGVCGVNWKASFPTTMTAATATQTPI